MSCCEPLITVTWQNVVNPVNNQPPPKSQFLYTYICMGGVSHLPMVGLVGSNLVALFVAIPRCDSQVLQEVTEQSASAAKKQQPWSFCRALASLHAVSDAWIVWDFAAGMYGDWMGLRENLQESIDFPIKYGVFLYIFP
jgi:hypothetical protein